MQVSTDGTRGAELEKARLEEVNLEKADLDGANLERAHLISVDVTQEQLATCKTRRGATLSEDTTVPDDQDFPPGWT